MKENFFENNNLELKREFSDSLLKTISAFSNYEGGTILIGVDDEKKFVGVDNIVEVKLMIENKINDTIVPRPNYQINILKMENKNLIEIKVFPEENTPYLYKGIAYQRKDTSTVPVDQTSLINLALKGKNLSFDQAPSNNDYFKFLTLEKYFKDIKQIDKFDKDILITLGLINSNKYTIAAELFADENNFSTSGIDIVRFGQSSSEFVDRKRIEKVSILKQYEEALFMFQKHYPEIEVVKGFSRVKKVQIPLEAYRESLANAIVHRDYLINSYIKISMYDNRIEITSPGGLPKGLDEENYLNDQISMPRNVIIAQILFMLGIIERFGTGIWRIKKSYQSYFLKPKYVIKKNFIKVVLPNLLFNDNDMIPEKRILNLLEMQLEIKRQDVEKLLDVNKAKAVEILNELLDKNLIKPKGKGRSSSYILDSSN
ncbi:MAG: putative DNA binding domain-containing protein [Bacilli bacterium]|nr:putative DNA binding domain-containing protein [Bacilli bacterium]